MSLPAFGSAQLSVKLKGLKPGKTYHFEVVAHNPDGTASSPDQTFSTVATAFSIGKVKVAANGTLTVTVKAKGGGKFSAKAQFHHGKFTYGKASKRNHGKGTVKLKIALSHKAATELKKLRKAKVTVKVIFTPSGGGSSTESVRVTVTRRSNGTYA